MNTESNNLISCSRLFGSPRSAEAEGGAGIPVWESQVHRRTEGATGVVRENHWDGWRCTSSPLEVRSQVMDKVFLGGFPGCPWARKARTRSFEEGRNHTIQNNRRTKDQGEAGSDPVQSADIQVSSSESRVQIRIDFTVLQDGVLLPNKN